MKVWELVEWLQGQRQDALVVIRDGESLEEVSGYVDSFGEIVLEAQGWLFPRKPALGGMKDREGV